MPNLFERAASLLLGDRQTEAGADAGSLLAELGYAAGDSGQPDPETPHRAELLKAASRFSRVFELSAPDAPGLVCLGAQFDPVIADAMHAGSPAVGVSGVGASMQEAFQRCIGEGIEYLSQLQTAEDVLERPGPCDPAAGLGAQGGEFLAAFLAHRVRPDTGLSWCRARRLTDGGEVLLPADLCLRRPPWQQEVKPPFPLSTGSAAGESRDAAALHGLLELIERDAASLWWRGGRRGRAIPRSDQASSAAQALLSQLRQNASARRSWLLDITTDIGVPCVASLSCKADGLGLAIGLAARPTLAAAAHSAVREMCQLELAYEIVEAKCREQGEAALNERDRVHRRRATAINADLCLLMQPLTEVVDHFPIHAAGARAVLELIDARLKQFSIETFCVDLTRPRFAVPVVRTITVGLQLEPSEIVTPRLADMIVRTGGGATHTGGLALA
jgi:ribosomal protein S12 methylthiotransferase accessory factor